ncbi:hypothetical protein CMI37_31670 [Candidatus Pacearchaeota archaeon]|nr:hypothetical protein [Candidatus Pacearchaeota archaeon]|tara:strand:- start:2468 stop:4882 length:2415 start_codon:yes stop_codon:yes gene_type:complete
MISQTKDSGLLAPTAAEAASKPEVMRPITRGWLGKINQAIDKRRSWDTVAKQCHSFFSGELGFMWEREFQSKYMNGSMQPRFKITLQKGFELVSIFGPSMYQQNPVRAIRQRKQLEFDENTFGPERMDLFQFAQQKQAEKDGDDDIRNQLMEMYLNYTPDEMPNGGLAQHANYAITDALITGRGVLWPSDYHMPGSDRTLSGCFYDSQDNLYYDPDCTSLADAWWICKKEVKPYWEFEREFKLPKDSLRGHASNESHNGRGEQAGNDMASHHRRQGQTNDLMVVYKVWSKMGVGGRMSGVDTTLRETLDEVCGDYCYLAVTDGVDWPLNAPSKAIESETDEQIERRFRWKHPFWRDDRWPCAVLEFYPNPISPYPIAPMAPGLGELTYLNIFISHLAGRTWSSSRDIIAVLERAAADVEGPLKSAADLAVIKLSEVNSDLNKCIQWIKQPEVNRDAFEMIDRITHLFEQRVGLNELLYGLSSTQSRSATDSKIKQKNLQIRPLHMSERVESWMDQLADMEKFVARWNVQGKDVRDLVGSVGAQLWDEKIVSEPMELVMREMRATVTAGSMRKPDHDKDAENINAVAATIFPTLDKHADMTGDTGPLNAFIDNWGEALQMEVDEIKMGPRQQQVSPEQEQQQQQMLQFEQQDREAELQKKQLELQKIQLDSQSATQRLQIDQQKAQLDIQRSQVQLETAAQQAQLEMGVKEADAADKQQDAELKRVESELKLRDAQIKSDEAEAASHAAAIESAADVAISQYSVEEKALDVEIKEAELELKKADVRLKQQQLLLDKTGEDGDDAE